MVLKQVRKRVNLSFSWGGINWLLHKGQAIKREGGLCSWQRGHVVLLFHDENSQKKLNDTHTHSRCKRGLEGWEEMW